MSKRERDEDYRATVREAVLSEDTFLRLTMSGALPGADSPWLKIVIRPALIRRRKRMLFAYFDGRKDVTKSFLGPEMLTRLDEALAMPFRHLEVQSTSGDLHLRVTKRGKALLTRAKPSRLEPEPALSHDRVKRRALLAGEPDSFLTAIGVTDPTGTVRPSMRGKFHQINEFIRLMEQMLRPEDYADRPLDIIDCGCGNAYLTFAAYHYLHHLRGIPAHVTGIDANDEIIASCRRLRDSLAWDQLDFQVAKIAGFRPPAPPEMVLSLHACDTATDEAIAQGILWDSRVILAAPCCQHELHSQLRPPPIFRPVLRHGILKERTADILTDAFRALVLRIMGYRTDVVQFVSPEHTAKNLMIRSRKGLKPGDAAAVREYRELKAFWTVEPCIEELLGDKLAQFLADR